MITSPVLTAWRTGDIGALAAAVSDDVVFSSPVTDYRGRDAALHILGLIGEVVEEPGPIRERSENSDVFHRFAAHIGGGEVEGVLHEERDSTGHLVHITLFLRPYAALRTAMAAMRALLEHSPLPARSE
ncbi:nuclear transport factor 2 family protein [Nocardia sp. NBC_01329]|uniref:nuclear transport factor 2 family protein n=1 Tax=Nocardia sp. NBC_01329 TaxID=2903594 RepID=UPI002E13C310|nr:nuclear transport factor 2 family protein [Nocardia sp. NBC_01329]